eukprot:NODE_2829_length_1083_cov_13.547071_g2698_i0.p1 GENE.NODE_2829_length_1083_cov_13.547071_g2698_i0~~NODE_2829_length_1083_cov_13.547071_g2698_i0.p1  ORF type:complete len:352 (+),score=95.60 NODE_2829_length_1083_cov_13.547071_g2698_i0:54-1058(+)
MSFFPPSTSNDLEVPQPPNEQISCLALGAAQGGHHLFAGSWDNQIRCWQIQQGNVTPKASTSAHAAPVLCLQATQEGICFSGACDNTVKMWQVGTEPETIGQHDQPVSTIRSVPEINAVMTGSWDKTVKLWDPRQPTLAGQVQLPEKCYAMDVQHPIAVFACADRHVVWYDLTKNADQRKISPLRFQTRSVCCFADRSGYAIGSIDGKLSVNYFQQNPAKFQTKCHRGADNKGPTHPAHTLAAFPVAQRADVFASGGGDGGVVFWDKAHKQRVHTLQPSNQPVVAGGFSSDGSLYAYALSYDFCKGPGGGNTATKPSIKLHSVTPQELAPKPKS